MNWKTGRYAWLCLGCAVSSFLVGAGPAVGQEGEGSRIETDRDSFTQALSVMEPGRFMVESAYSFTDNRDRKETHSLPELLIRYGLTDIFELQFGTNYEIGGEASVVSGGSSGGLRNETGMGGELEEEARIFYGLKTRLTDQRGCLPESAITVSGYTPTSGEETNTSLIAGYVFGWELENEWHIASEIRYRFATIEGDSLNVWAPSVVLKHPVGESLEAHIEYFGIFSDGTDEDFARQFISPGASYLLTPDIEIGLRTGWGLNDQSPNFFSNVGFGVRF